MLQPARLRPSSDIEFFLNSLAVEVNGGILNAEKDRSGAGLALAATCSASLVGEQRRHVKSVAFESTFYRMVDNSRAQAEVASGTVNWDRNESTIPSATAQS
jgi:hypothetical protein